MHLSNNVSISCFKSYPLTYYDPQHPLLAYCTSGHQQVQVGSCPGTSLIAYQKLSPNRDRSVPKILLPCLACASCLYKSLLRFSALLSPCSSVSPQNAGMCLIYSASKGFYCCNCACCLLCPNQRLIACSLLLDEVLANPP